MKIIVAVVVYDRFQNVEEWIRCYKVSNTQDSELVIIHNMKNDEEMKTCRDICLRENIKYVPRKNIGYDIGALQDVCNERLAGFPNEWDYLFWNTDDVIPMWKSFIHGFLVEIQQPNIGIACLEISDEAKRHIRTSGFIASKRVTKRLTFPVDPIITKGDCYQFEHRSRDAFYEQIIKMGMKVKQVSPTLMVSHLWDTDRRSHLNRWKDHYGEFPNNVSPHLDIPPIKTNNIIVAVIVYNRFDNIKTWINCWKTCEKENAQLVIIHNYDKESDCTPYREHCKNNNIKYIARKNVGQDIGAFQDVCKERLAEFPNNWNILFWTTDDVIPMNTNFLSEFINPIKNNVALSCYEYSTFVTPHIRSLQFCIRKDVSKRLIFSADPILTKEHCYKFEHDGEITLFKQIQKMGLTYHQVGDIRTSPIWDTGHRITLNRWREHYNIFKLPKVAIISTAFNRYPQIIPSLICQTHKNWELYLVHDGITHVVRHYANAFKDPRVIYSENNTTLGNYGHITRQNVLRDMKNKLYATDCDYVVITNEDNYLAPIFLEKMIGGFKSNTIATYCSMVHNYFGYKAIDTKLEMGHIDSSAVMIKKDIACDVGWNSMIHSADWVFFKEIIDKYGKDKWVKVDGNLLMHN